MVIGQGDLVDALMLHEGRETLPLKTHLSFSSRLAEPPLALGRGRNRRVVSEFLHHFGNAGLGTREVGFIQHEQNWEAPA